MTEWSWLMITLALINTVQWPNSMAHHTYDHNPNREEYLWYPARNRPKRTSLSAFDDNTATTALTYNENQKNYPVSNIKNILVRNSQTANMTVPGIKYQNTSNNTNKQPNSGLQLSQTKVMAIVFPKTNLKFIPEIHEMKKCSLNQTFCTKVDNYPRQDLFNLFRNSKFMSTSYFETNTENNLDETIETRFSDPNLRSFCEPKEEVIFPQAGMTKNDDWRYIVQDENNVNSSYKQEVRVVKCSNAGTPCQFNDLLPRGYTSICVQKYFYKKLVAIKDSKEVYYESFKFPSCCECMYSVNSDLLTRHGGYDLENRFQNQPETSRRNKDMFNNKNSKS